VARWLVRQYYNANYVKIAWDGFYGGFFVARYEQMQSVTSALAYKKYDLKTIEVWQAEQYKRQRFVAFFGNNLAFILCGVLRADWFFFASK
jgi:hypothetical protein